MAARRKEAGTTIEDQMKRMEMLSTTRGLDSCPTAAALRDILTRLACSTIKTSRQTSLVSTYESTRRQCRWREDPIINQSRLSTRQEVLTIKSLNELPTRQGQASFLRCEKLIRMPTFIKRILQGFRICGWSVWWMDTVSTDIKYLRSWNKACRWSWPT